ncbi:DUF1998 domain-containing protein [Planomonospora sp. ID82291]|nr:DUF1998 domain-containing protein [Planomonospora sp. ID82291]
MITTYGVGAMVAVGDRSYIVSGLDGWKVDEAFSIREPRLQYWLKVHGFKLPPAADPPAGDGVRVRLFPEIYSCSNCHALKEFRRFGSPRGKSQCGACERPLTPSRFVVACENGHLDDFPYFAWVHKKTSPADASSDVRHELTLHSTGRTASLRSVVVRCSCGKAASLEGAFGKGAMRALGISCSGRRPWLGRGSEQRDCPAAPRTLQRGSSAAWFPISRSAISIPPWSQTIQKRIDPYYATFKTLLERQVDENIVIETIRSSGVLKGARFTEWNVLEAVRRRQGLEAAEHPDPEEWSGFEPAGELRREEYEQLLFGTANVDQGDDFECVAPSGDSGTSLPRGIGRTMLVKRLREVRALQSFTRVEMPTALAGDTRRSAMSNTDVGWLPAVEVSGEGVFLTLDAEELRRWETKAGPRVRAGQIHDNHTALMRRRIMIAAGTAAISEIWSPIDARYVLLHTLAHVLINEWSLDAGYPTAALRERLYVSEDMAGVLIYTATSDSAGSLGGVVAQGEHKRLRISLESALSRVSWCSQDPPCMEAEATGVDSLNLAACYACVLLPETSCETNNTFLDRALLVGTPDDPSIGFFSREGLGTV